MDREDFIGIGERSLARLRSLAPRPEDIKMQIIRTTSGTTGKRPLVVAQKITPDLFKMFEGSARPVVCMGAMNARLTNVLGARYTDGAVPIRVISIEAKDVTSKTDLLLADFMPDTFRGTPSFVAGVLQTLPATARSRVQKVHLTGELLTEQQAHALAEQVPNAVIRMTYATSELGPLSQPGCPYLKRNQYHPRADVRIEIKNPDGDGAGEVCVSTALEGERVEQYTTGDVAFFLSPCQCGAPVTFELIGRTGRDYVKLSGATLRREEFDRVTKLFSYIDDYRAEAREVAVEGASKGSITLMLYHRGGPVTDALIEETKKRFSRELFLTPTQTLADLVKQKIFLPLEIVQTAGPFAQENKDIKVRMISR